jgi:hypothetical protein
MILIKKDVHLARGRGGYSSVRLLLGPQPQLLPPRFKLFLAVEKEYGGSTDDTASLTGRHIPNLHLLRFSNQTTVLQNTKSLKKDSSFWIALKIYREGELREGGQVPVFGAQRDELVPAVRRA